MNALRARRVRSALGRGYSGPGYFAGQAPDPAVPDSPDGRFRILNEPARGRVQVFERSSMICVADTLSSATGEWHIGYLNPALFYVVIGWDDAGQQNAAIQDWVKPYVPE